ncbi:hypothetical protein [Marinicrinis sediminis]|uniref:Secreted protein n=1 Tax=Marinicrinis sediminis TaxID=1652465 RepID=A0ABW5RAN5_9BACL
MIVGLIWIIGIYGTAMLTVHLLHHLLHHEQRASKHYLLWIPRQQLQLEWFLRMVLVWNWTRGTPIRMTLMVEQDEHPVTKEVVWMAAKILNRAQVPYQIHDQRYPVQWISRTPHEEMVQIQFRAHENLKQWVCP